jgi:hypothetical protein
VLLIDNWALRRWLLWPWCALRGHRPEFWLTIRWNVLGESVPGGEISRCSCGRRSQKRAARESG